MKSIVTAADMQLKNRLFRFTDPASLPLSFRYNGCLIQGIPGEFAPETTFHIVDANIFQYTICGRNQDGLEIRVEYLEYCDYSATEFVAYFTNHGSTDTGILSDIKIIDRVIEGGRGLLIHGNGDTVDAEGYQWFHDPVNRTIEKTPADGTACKGAFPYMRLMFEGWGVNIGIGWPAPWKAAFSPDEKGVKVSIGQSRCRMVIHSGETMRTPRVNFLAFTGDETRGTNMWRRWYFAHIIPREEGRPIPPKYCLHVLDHNGVHTTATEESQLQGIDDYLKHGLHPDIWWMDAGWYPCDEVWTTTGSWYPDPKRFPNGLKPIGQKCEENNIRFLLWFELERIIDGTDLFNEHPEWLLRLKRNDGSDCYDSLLDLGIPECCDAAIEIIDKNIKESHVKIYRQDFNCDPAPCWEFFEAGDRIGAIENLHVQGYLRLWDTLLMRNPGLWIDSCASGGRRNDLESMRRAVPLHYTDVGYGNHPIKQKQHQQMFAWLPYFRAHNSNWDDPATGSYGDSVYNGPAHAPDKYSYYAAMAPALTDTTEHDADPEGFELARTMLPIWRRAAKIMVDSDYYPLTECRKSSKDFFALQFHNPDTQKGLLLMMSNNQNPDTIYHARLQALKDDQRYILTSSEDNSSTRHTGTELKKGIAFELQKRSGIIYFYERG